MFDTSQPFRTKIISGEEKIFVYRWPTDEELCAHVRSLRTRQAIGGGDPASNSLERDGALLRLLGTELPASFSDTEASEVLGRAFRLRLKTVEPASSGATMTFEAPGRSEVIHELRFPTKDQQVKYDRAKLSVEKQGRQIVTRLYLEPAVALYDALHVRSEGYAGKPPAVPAIHKRDALHALFDYIEDLEGDEGPEA